MSIEIIPYREERDFFKSLYLVEEFGISRLSYFPLLHYFGKFRLHQVSTNHRKYFSQSKSFLHFTFPILHTCSTFSSLTKVYRSYPLNPRWPYLYCFPNTMYLLAICALESLTFHNAYPLLSLGYKPWLKKLKEMRIPDIQYSCSLVSVDNEFTQFVFLASAIQQLFTFFLLPLTPNHILSLTKCTCGSRLSNSSSLTHHSSTEVSFLLFSFSVFPSILLLFPFSNLLF